MTLLVAMNM